MSWEPIASIGITVAMAVGVALRHRPRRHIPLMWGVIVSDVALLLWVELSRGAIHTATQGAAAGTMPAFLVVHIGLALACIAGYLFAIASGIKLWRDPTAPIRSLHRANGWTVLVARIGLLLTTPGLLPFFPELTR